jgi:hypothetical protein
VTGLIFWYVSNYAMLPNEYGFAANPLQTPTLHFHGVLGLLFLFVFGILFSSHIQPGLRQTRRKPTGVSLFLILTLLSITVPLLYYLGEDHWRKLTADFHTLLGLALVPMIIMHLGAGYFFGRTKL